MGVSRIMPADFVVLRLGVSCGLSRRWLDKREFSDLNWGKTAQDESNISTVAALDIVGVDPAAFNSGCGGCNGYCIDCLYRCEAGNGDRPT